MVISTSILLDFSNLGYSEWSLRHAFFADMGGFVLNSSDYSQLPVNACQVCYLVANGFMRFPTVDSETIWDKNKADAFARVLTSVQVLWFAFQCIGRAAQHLPISTFELDTVAFILCTFPTFYYWRRKPLDVSTPITLFLHDGVQVRDILLLAGKSASRPFRFTPLDFANPTPDPYEVWDFNMWAVQLLFGFDADSKRKPVSTFRNSSRMASGRTGIINYSVISVFAISHLCHIFGVAAEEINNATQLLETFHLVLQYLIAGSLVGSYVIGRIYLIFEAFIGLRALPADTFESVNWSNFFPHV